MSQHDESQLGMSHYTRRRFLGYSGAVLVGGGLIETVAGCTKPKVTPAPTAPVEPSLVPATSAAPTTAPTASWDLDAQWMDATFNGTKARLRSFNGTIPGPMITVKPGDTLQVTVKNGLTPYDSAGWSGDHNVPHELNTTNLHLHGLDIAPHLFEPQGTGDPTAEMIAIRPGTNLAYTFQIPADHPPGFYWYHPHRHGSTAVQCVSGMAGGMIVRGDVDEVPEIKAAKDLPIVLQDIGLFPGQDDPEVWTYNPKQNAYWDTFGGRVVVNGQPAPELTDGFTTGDYKRRFYLVNGEAYFEEDHNDAAPTSPSPTQLTPPTLATLQPGEVARFRLLNANSDNLMPIVVEGHELQLIALDGVNFPVPRALPVTPIDAPYGQQQLLLAPANRAEFLLKASATPGTYKIVQLAQTTQFLASAAKVIGQIVVEGEPKDMALPDSLPTPARYYPLIEPAEIVRRRVLVFNTGFPPVMNLAVGVDFTINNQLYDEQAIDATMDLDTAEEWYLSVPGGQGVEGHPFHIHVNHFELISIGGIDLPAGTIQDTVWIPPGSQVVIRHKFKEWTGKAVYHCHILPHEDTGMMQNMLILEETSSHHGDTAGTQPIPSAPPAASTGMPGMSHPAGATPTGGARTP
jgi:FtsP/CotA-like multicopper oxidase with cupredoxin domain